MGQGAAFLPSCETTEMSLMTWPLPTHPTLFLTAGSCPPIPKERTKQTARCWPCRPIPQPSWASVSGNMGRTTGSEGVGDWVGPRPCLHPASSPRLSGPWRVSPAALPTLCHLPTKLTVEGPGSLKCPGYWEGDRPDTDRSQGGVRLGGHLGTWLEPAVGKGSCSLGVTLMKVVWGLRWTGLSRQRTDLDPV